MKYLGTLKQVEAEAYRLALFALDLGRDGEADYGSNGHHDLIVDLVAMEESEEWTKVVLRVEEQTGSEYYDETSKAYLVLETVRRRAYMIVRAALEGIMELRLCDKCQPFKIMERLVENPDLCSACFESVDEFYYDVVTEAKMAAFRAHWASLSREERSLECDELGKDRCGPDEDPDCDVIEAIGRRDLGWDS